MRRSPSLWLTAASAVLLPVAALAPSTASSTAASGAPGRPVAAAVGTATAKASPGRWHLTRTGSQTWSVSWRSPSRLPPTSDRPTLGTPGAPDALAEAPTVAPDGRTVLAAVRSSTPITAGDLDVVLSGDRLDEPGDDRTAGLGPAPAHRTAAPTVTTALGVDPGTPGPHPTRTSDYSLDPVMLPGMTEPIEMVGHVVEPAPGEISGAAPLVLLQHGRHGVCYDPAHPRHSSNLWPCAAPFEEIPSQLGYDYLQQLLASQGFVTVSVRVNGINAQDYRLPDGGAASRAAIIQRHLDYWTTIAAAHHVDLRQTVLVGHSRGGEGVDRASIEIGLSAPYRIVGQVLIAPTDFGSQTAPYVPTVTLLPYCDGDVSDLQGQRYTDYSRDLARDDTSLKSSVLVLGANHNFFNTEWTPGVAAAPANDDWFGPPDKACGTADPGRLGASEQRDVAATYVAGAVRLFTGEEDLLPMFDGSVVDLPSIGAARVLTHALGGGRELRRPRLETGLSSRRGAQTSFCEGITTYGPRVGYCGEQITRQVTPHWTSSYEGTPAHPFFEMSWDAAGQRGGLELGRPLDLTERRLELRTLVDPRVGAAEIGVRLVDADGAAAVLTPEGGSTVPALPPGYAKIWAQTVLVDPTRARGVDVSRIAEVDLVSRSDVGHLWIADLAAAPARLAPVPVRRSALLDLGHARVLEGDGPGTARAEIPFTVTGLKRPASALVVLVGDDRRRRYTLDLAPGQTHGTIPATMYEPNTVDDLYLVGGGAVAYALAGVMTDSYVGSVRVTDDDPTPRVRLTAVRRTVHEGEPVKVALALDEPVGYSLQVGTRIVRGPRPDLRSADLPPGLRRELDLAGDPAHPVGADHPSLGYRLVRDGTQRIVLRVPTRDDERHEGRESLTLQVTYVDGDGRHVLERTAYVARSD